jgi:hypothetical protein
MITIMPEQMLGISVVLERAKVSNIYGEFPKHIKGM